MKVTFEDLYYAKTILKKHLKVQFFGILEEMGSFYIDPKCASCKGAKKIRAGYPPQPPASIWEMPEIKLFFTGSLPLLYSTFEMPQGPTRFLFGLSPIIALPFQSVTPRCECTQFLGFFPISSFLRLKQQLQTCGE